MCPGHTALCRPQGVVPRPRKALLGGSESRLQTLLGPSHPPCGPQGRPPVQAHIRIAGQPSCSSSGQGVKEPVSSDWENHSTQCWGGGHQFLQVGLSTQAGACMRVGVWRHTRVPVHTLGHCPVATCACAINMRVHGARVQKPTQSRLTGWSPQPRHLPLGVNRIKSTKTCLLN